MKRVCPVASSIFGLNIYLNSLFSYSLDPLIVRDKVFHPHQLQTKLQLCILESLYSWTACCKNKDSGPNSSKHFLNLIHSLNLYACSFDYFSAMPKYLIHKRTKHTGIVFEYCTLQTYTECDVVLHNVM
jgi:hypothetical protein